MRPGGRRRPCPPEASRTSRRRSRICASRTRNTITVGAGDLIGASPLVSALFHDEPTIESMNVDRHGRGGVGNHEFDEGVPSCCACRTAAATRSTAARAATCSRVPTSSTSPRTCSTGHGRDDPAAVRDQEDRQREDRVHRADARGHADDRHALRGRRPRVPARGRRPSTRSCTSSPQGQGIKAFVVLLHQGGSRTPGAGVPGAREPRTHTSDVEQVRELRRAGDHLDRQRPRSSSEGRGQRAHPPPYICTIDGKLVTSAASFGRVVTDIDLEIDTSASEIKWREGGECHRQAERRRPKDGNRRAILALHDALSAPLANRVVGTITRRHPLARGTPDGQNAAGEQPMGDVIADAMLEARPDRLRRRGGGVHELRRRPRRACSSTRSRGGEQPGEVTYAEAFTVQPFGNTLVVKTCTGRQMYDVLEQQFNNPAAGRNRIMLVSRTSTTTGRRRRAAHRDGTLSFDRGDHRRQGRRATGWSMNNFMADGGDGYTVFRTVHRRARR